MSGPCSTTTASTDQALQNGASLYGGLRQWSLSLEVSRVSHLEPKRSRQQIPETKMGKFIFGMSRKRIRLPQSCAYTERRMAVNMVCLFLHISSSHQKRHRLPVNQSVDKIRRISPDNLFWSGQLWSFVRTSRRRLERELCGNTCYVCWSVAELEPKTV